MKSLFHSQGSLTRSNIQPKIGCAFLKMINDTGIFVLAMPPGPERGNVGAPNTNLRDYKNMDMSGFARIVNTKQN